jgi:cysteine-rich repeat protein
MEPTRARTLASITFAFASAIAVSLPAFVATDARAQLVTPEDRCQADLAKTSRKYLERVLKYRIKCQNKVITGDLPLATDCLFGLGDAVLSKQLLKTQARLSVSGSDCNGVNLQLLGFPNLCDDDSGFPFDTSDFKQCVLERTDLILDELLDYYYPPLFERQRGDIALCLQGSPKDAMDSLIGKIRAREKCLVGQAYGKVLENVDCYEKILPYGGGTGDGRTDDSLGRAYVELLGTIPKACAITNINDLDYQSKCPDATGGNFNIFDLKNCLFDADRVAALEALGTVFPTEGICGDGNVQGEEECDDGVAGNSDTIPNACRTDCKNPVCGDSVRDDQFAETCDDGNSVDTDCCRDSCVVSSCGDGVPATGCGEQCDLGSGNMNAPNICRATGPNACKNPRCGDGIQDSAEQCDDGNTVSEDLCSGLCFVESCGDEIIQPGLGEQCDNGTDNGTLADQCRPMGHPFACKNPSCGDGTTDTGEACDDGNTIPEDGCTGCIIDGVCGDGIVQSPREECDGSDAPCPGGTCTGAEPCTCETVCPTEGELVLYAGYGQPCSVNTDCDVGVCDQVSGNCRTVTRLDSGWIGLAHNADINDEVVTRGFLDCGDSHGPTCGVCEVDGIDPTKTDTCRCSNNSRTICDDKFSATSPDCKACANNVNISCSTNTDCPGSTCTNTSPCLCYFGAPFPLASGGTPACIVNRFSADVSGTANVDLGEGAISAKLRTRVYLGLSTTIPCPPCGGKCSNAATSFCVRDEDCPSGGTCNDDPVANDGLRQGTCAFGAYVANYEAPDEGQPCDKSAFNASFPAFPTGPGGGWYSLDCMPDVGKNVAGAGLIINLTQTTGSVSLESNVSCQGPSASLDCPCMTCSNDPTLPCNVDSECLAVSSTCSLGTGLGAARCTSNSDCASANAGNCGATTFKCQFAASIGCATNSDCQGIPLGTCRVPTCSSIGTGDFPLPNACTNLECSDSGGGVGQCTTGPDSLYCDGVLKANGAGVLACQGDDSCTAGSVGVDAGFCTLVERSGCFLDPITVSGDPDPSTPIGASVFCIPPTSNVGINSAAGLPGPGRVINQAKSRTFCGNDTTQQYIPGVGGCAD